MKKIIFLFFFSVFFIGVYAQIVRPTNWELTRNPGTTNLHFLGTTDCKPIIFKTRNMERMRLSQNHSFLGIGLTDPQAPLHVHHQLDEMPCGEIIIVDGDGDSTSVRSTSMLGRKLLQLTTPETGFANHNGFNIFSNAAKDVILRQQEQGKFFIEGPGGGLTIAPNGNIGIGIGNPETKLHINHTATFDYSFAALININRDLTKALAVRNTATNEEVFVLYGNGVLSTKKNIYRKN
ncbi:MAG: hypothetical protein FWC34_12015 [Bacteroidetes bacterium]|nr:hypothetical protein [Bacteroidota bacterium]MCL2301921.1 hypothetical protein [Lentimicrobiaceae bacterium]